MKPGAGVGAPGGAAQAVFSVEAPTLIEPSLSVDHVGKLSPGHGWVGSCPLPHVPGATAREPVEPVRVKVSGTSMTPVAVGCVTPRFHDIRRKWPEATEVPFVGVAGCEDAGFGAAA